MSHTFIFVQVRISYSPNCGLWTKRILIENPSMYFASNDFVVLFCKIFRCI